MTTLTLQGTFATIECCKCSMTFAVPLATRERWIDTREYFYCPAGHSQHYDGKSDAEKLKDELAISSSLLANARAARDSALRESEHHRRSATLAKGRHRALKTRIAAGLCPCCRRPFANLMAHMQHKHPQYRPDAEGAKTE